MYFKELRYRIRLNDFISTAMSSAEFLAATWIIGAISVQSIKLFIRERFHSALFSPDVSEDIASYKSFFILLHAIKDEWKEDLEFLCIL